MRKTLTYMETRAYTKNPNRNGKPYLNAKPATLVTTLTCMKNIHLMLKEKAYGATLQEETEIEPRHKCMWYNWIYKYICVVQLDSLLSSNKFVWYNWMY